MEYIDLGLPSGTKWAESNEEGFYTFNEAVKNYGDNLPTREQFEELKKQCKWEWNGGGYEVTGPNGNTIVLPAEGYRGCDGGVVMDSYGDYWSSTPTDSCMAWYLFFNFSSVCMHEDNWGYGFSVRLVKNKDNNMKDKEINIADILKDCPKGMKLYATTVGECTLEDVTDDDRNYPIIVRQKDAEMLTFSFTAYGKAFDVADAECQLFPSKDNRDWSTFKAPRPKHEFKPFEKVLVRDSNIDCWTAGLFSHSIDDDNMEYRYAANGVHWKMCIPYEGNEHLLGTCDSPDEKGGAQ